MIQNRSQRIHILGLPIDIVEDSALQAAVESRYNSSDSRQIVLLTFRDLMRARRSTERRQAVEQAALVIPVSPILIRAARFLKLPPPRLYHPYSFVIKLLGILEKKGKSVYLLGASGGGLKKAESTLRAGFPGMRIVGRYAAYFPAEREKDIVTAIKKSTPTLLLTGKGLKGGHLWSFRRKSQFTPGLSIHEPVCFDVFSGRKPKPEEREGRLFFKSLFGLLLRPWRFFRIFRYLLFFILLLFERMRRAKGK